MRAKYTFHKTFFSIPDSKQLKLFENFLDADYDRLECSIKIVGDQINASRFMIFSYAISKYTLMIDILKKYSIIFDFDLDQVILFFQAYSKYANAMFFGIDDNIEKFRIKIGFTLENAVDVVAKFVEIFNINFSGFRMDKTICSLDIYSNGNIDPKVYSGFDCSGEGKLIEDFYGEKINPFIQNSLSMWVCKRTSNSGDMLHFDVSGNLSSFSKKIKNDKLTSLIFDLKNKTEFTLFENRLKYYSFSLSELEKGEFHHINFYY